ncbi:MAG: response regulator [Betaproteobacteria bacterium]
MLSGLQILIADSNLSRRQWLREQLILLGGKAVAQAVSSTDLMRQVGSNHIDIVICDQHLNEKRNGLFLLQELRQNYGFKRQNIFIILTKETTTTQVADAALSPDGFIVRPFTPRQLADFLDTALKTKKVLYEILEQLNYGRHEAAIAACDKVIYYAPNYLLEALRLKAESLVALGRCDEATALYAAIPHQHETSWALGGHASLLLQQGEGPAAKELCLRLARSHPEYVPAYLMLAQVHEANGDFTQALELLDKATTKASSCTTTALRKLAELAEIVGDHPKAIAALKKLTEPLRHSSMIKADDYLSLIAMLLAENHVTEARKINGRMELEVPLPEGQLAATIATAMISRHTKNHPAEKSCLQELLVQLEQDISAISDALFLRICEELFIQNELMRIAPRLARWSSRPDLPPSIKALLAKIFDASEKASATYQIQQTTKDHSPWGIQLISALHTALDNLEADWSSDHATLIRNLLIDTFTLMPGHSEVIDCHLRFNLAAIRQGEAIHWPTRYNGDGALITSPPDHPVTILAGSLLDANSVTAVSQSSSDSPPAPRENAKLFLQKTIRRIEKHGIKSVTSALKRAARDSKGQQRTNGIIEAIAAYGIRSGRVEVYDAAIQHGASLTTRIYREKITLGSLVAQEPIKTGVTAG